MDNTRRGFLTTAAAVSVLGAQAKKKYRTALIGTGWWGMNILGCAMESGECQVMAMCDVDENQLNPAAEKVVKLSGDQPKKYRHFQEMLDREKPDIAIVATPDHWHPLCAVAAMNTGAHVYVEKPIGHTVKEGRAMVRAARANNRVVQVGLHRRVSPHNRSGIEFLKSGKAGKIGMVRAFVQNGGGTGRRSVTDIEIGHRSTNMSLLGVLSLKLGRSIQWDGDKEQIIGDPEANQLLSREYRGPWKYPV